MAAEMQPEMQQTIANPWSFHIFPYLSISQNVSLRISCEESSWRQHVFFLHLHKCVERPQAISSTTIPILVKNWGLEPRGPSSFHHFIISSSLPTQICNVDQCISMWYVNIVTTLGKGRILQPWVNCWTWSTATSGITRLSHVTHYPAAYLDVKSLNPSK